MDYATKHNLIESARGRDALVQFCLDRLERSGKLFVCPFCSSGQHKNMTGAFSVMPDGTHWKCFACGQMGDIFDLARQLDGNEDGLQAWAGVDFGGSGRRALAVPRPIKKKAEARRESPLSESKILAWRREQIDYVRRCQRRVGDPAPYTYLLERGIATEDAVGLGIGYDPALRSIVMPVPGTPWYAITRRTDRHEYRKPPSKFGTQPVWNPQAFSGRGPVWIVEGPFDAYALALAGGSVVALLGTHGIDKVVQAAQEREYRGIVVAMTDNDEAGHKAQEDIVGAFAAVDGVRVVPYAWARGRAPEGCKDPGEWWQRDREGLRNVVHDMSEWAHRQ